MSPKVETYRKVQNKSWVVELRQGKMVVEASTWAPGYTPAHHETKAAAIMHAMSKAIDESEAMKERIAELATMLNEETKDINY